MLDTIRRKLTRGLPDRAREQWSRVLRPWFRKYIGRMPPVASEGKPRAELHMLCGANAWDMGVWASWSILRFTPEARLVVHSDGSLAPEHTEPWRRVVPTMRVIDKAWRDAAVEPTLSDYPALRSWRASNLYSAQLLDIHVLAETDAVISMDSDVLCFADPTVLRAELCSARLAMRWNRDWQGGDFYIAPADALAAIVGRRPAQAVNAGFLLAPRLGSEGFALLNHYVEALGWRDQGRLLAAHAAQTLYAMLAADDGEPLPGTYAVIDGPKPPDTVVRHYVTQRSIRPRFFTEGLAELSLSLEAYP